MAAGQQANTRIETLKNGESEVTLRIQRQEKDTGASTGNVNNEASLGSQQLLLAAS